jgi:oligopeptide transport system permease protein
MGVMLVYGFLLMFFNTLVDVGYAFLDPRVELK